MLREQSLSQHPRPGPPRVLAIHAARGSHERIVITPSTDQGIRELADAYLAELEHAGRSAHTLRAYRSELTRLAARSTGRPTTSRTPGSSLCARPKSSTVFTQTHAIADELLKPEALGQRRDQQHPGVGYRPLMVHDPLDVVQVQFDDVWVTSWAGRQLPKSAAFSLLRRANYATSRTTNP
jgi:hypothetical protein